jgi:hypothetical protein
VPLALLSFYRERVFPIVKQHGFVPVTADEVVAPGDTILPKIDALIGRAVLMVVDASPEFTVAELRLALNYLDPTRILAVKQQESGLPTDVQGIQVITRSDVTTTDPEQFLIEVEKWLTKAAERLRPTLLAEPTRLLGAGEYRAAVISAISLLESVLRRKVEVGRVSTPRAGMLRDLLDHANTQGMLGDTSVNLVLEWLKIRNEVVHRHRPVSKTKAEQIVNGVNAIVQLHF